MPIEFNCGQCRYRLRTPDDSAGKQSRCPQCGHIQPIPAKGGFSPDAAGESSAPPWTPRDNPFSDNVGAAVSRQNNPYAAPTAVSAHPPNRNATVLPGALLIAVAVTSIIFLVLALLAGVLTVMDEGVDDDDVMVFALLGFTLAVQLLILWGGINLVRQRGYTMAMVGAVVAVIPLSLCWCLHVPFGAWALATLSQRGMRAVFANPRARR